MTDLTSPYLSSMYERDDDDDDGYSDDGDLGSPSGATSRAYFAPHSPHSASPHSASVAAGAGAAFSRAADPRLYNGPRSPSRSSSPPNVPPFPCVKEWRPVGVD